MPDEDSETEVAPFFEGETFFEIAVEMAEHCLQWIDWADPIEPIKKPICFTLSLLQGDLGSYVPEMVNFLFDTLQERNGNDYSPIVFYQRYHQLYKKNMCDRTEFVKYPELTLEKAEEGQEKYYRTEHILSLVGFLLLHRPCCRLVQTAWLIPAIAAGVPAIPLVAYAAERFADFINDPVEPYEFECTPVGNSWLHRLAVFLLQQCRVQSIPPDDSLIRLISLVSPPPSASVKSGKATRTLDYLADPPPTHYMHEAPPDKAVGTALALELLGEFDANRQGEHYRRLERAVAHYGNCQLDGKQPSIKELQRASGLSWADAKEIVGRPFFSQLVFQYQCRYLTLNPEHCPECEALARRLNKEDTRSGHLMRSSESSW